MTRHEKIRYLLKESGFNPNDPTLLIRDGTAGHSVPHTHHRAAELTVDGRVVGVYTLKTPPPVSKPIEPTPTVVPPKPPAKKGLFK